eukprot:5853682-Lingulodinium_polyedra.AAC.1
MATLATKPTNNQRPTNPEPRTTYHARTRAKHAILRHVLAIMPDPCQNYALCLAQNFARQRPWGLRTCGNPSCAKCAYQSLKRR